MIPECHAKLNVLFVMFGYLKYHQEEGKNGSGTGTGLSTRPGSEYYAIDFIHRCAYSLQSIPDLDVWAKYCCPEEEGSN